MSQAAAGRVAPRTTGGATQWIVTGDPLPPDDAPITAVFGRRQAVAGGWRAPLRDRTGAGRRGGTVWVRAGRVTIQAARRAQWSVRVGLLLWIAGWVVWLLRRR